MGLAHCTRDMSTRPPSVVARSVIRNELIPVLEWFINGKPGQLQHLRRYAEKAQDLLQRDGLGNMVIAGWLAGQVAGWPAPSAEELLAECRRLHEGLREAEQIWQAGSPEALERIRRIAEKGRAAIRNASLVGQEGTSEGFAGTDPTQAPLEASDASEGPRCKAGESRGESPS